MNVLTFSVLIRGTSRHDPYALLRIASTCSSFFDIAQQTVIREPKDCEALFIDPEDNWISNVLDTLTNNDSDWESDTDTDPGSGSGSDIERFESGEKTMRHGFGVESISDEMTDDDSDRGNGKGKDNDCYNDSEGNEEHSDSSDEKTDSHYRHSVDRNHHGKYDGTDTLTTQNNTLPIENEHSIDHDHDNTNNDKSNDDDNKIDTLNTIHELCLGTAEKSSSIQKVWYHRAMCNDDECVFCYAHPSRRRKKKSCPRGFPERVFDEPRYSDPILRKERDENVNRWRNALEIPPRPSSAIEYCRTKVKWMTRTLMWMFAPSVFPSGNVESANIGPLDTFFPDKRACNRNDALLFMWEPRGPNNDSTGNQVPGWPFHRISDRRCTNHIQTKKISKRHDRSVQEVVRVSDNGFLDIFSILPSILCPYTIYDEEVISCCAGDYSVPCEGKTCDCENLSLVPNRLMFHCYSACHRRSRQRIRDSLKSPDTLLSVIKEDVASTKGLVWWQMADRCFSLEYTAICKSFLIPDPLSEPDIGTIEWYCFGVQERVSVHASIIPSMRYVSVPDPAVASQREMDVFRRLVRLCTEHDDLIK